MAANDDFDMLHQLAERLGLDESEGENFITSSMRRLGHKPRVQWDDGEESGGGGVTDFFGGKRREQRRVGGERGQRRPSGEGWQYGA